MIETKLAMCECDAFAICQRHGDDDYYCPSCYIEKHPDHRRGVDYERWAWAEHDGACYCCQCGHLLAYTLTDYGVDEELEIFSSSGKLDWNNPDDCFRMARVVGAISENDPRWRQVLQIVGEVSNE